MIKVFYKNQDVVWVLLLTVFAWVGIVDQYAEEYINASLVSAGTSFGVAKLFNATVSVLSTITLNIPVVGSIQIGELLDPLNDLVEDFSSVMKYAISSLLIQKFLVEILQTVHFKVFLLISGIAFVLTKYTLREYRSVAYKVFLFAVICKFSIAAVALGSSWVDKAFIDQVVQQENSVLESFPVSPDQLDETLDLSSEIKQQISTEIEAVEIEQQIMQTQLQALQRDAEDTQKKIADVDARVAELSDGKSGFASLFEKASEEKQSLREQRIVLRHQLKSIQYDMEETQDEIAESKETVSDLRDRLQGERSTFQSIRDGFNQVTVAAKDKITGFVSTLNQSMDHFLNLIALFVLKTVIIPLVFLVVIYKVFVRLWSGTPNTSVQCFRESIQQTSSEQSENQPDKSLPKS